MQMGNMWLQGVSVVGLLGRHFRHMQHSFFFFSCKYQEKAARTLLPSGWVAYIDQNYVADITTQQIELPNQSLGS